MDKAKVMGILIKHEGIKPYAYQDHLGFWTIGCGRLIDERRGGYLSETEIFYLLNNDIDKCVRDLSEIIFRDEFDSFPEDIQTVLVSMRFQMGAKGFRGFNKMVQAFKNKDYKEAVRQMKDSEWYRDKKTQKRAEELIKMVVG